MSDKLCRRCGLPDQRYRGNRATCRDCEALKARRRRVGQDINHDPVEQRIVLLPKPKPDALRHEADEPQGPTILVIPDTQAKPGVPVDHMRWAGRYINEHRPQHVVHLGDHVDFPSLSRYDSPAAKALNGYNSEDDVKAAEHSLYCLMSEVERPELSTWDYCGGNHDHRREIALAKDPHLSIPDWRTMFHDWGWTVHEFLKGPTIEGITFAHFFPRSANGKITQTKRGAPSARAQAQREKGSTVAGHAQGLDTAIQGSSMGRTRAIIAGSFYLHDEDYMPDNDYWRGLLELRDCRNGDYELKEISMRHLRRRYS